MIFYKLKNKKYRDTDYVKDCSLTNIEFDKNFYELEGKDVKKSYRDPNDATNLVIELYDGTKIIASGVLADKNISIEGEGCINVRKTQDGDYIIGLKIDADASRKGLFVNSDGKLDIKVASHEQFGTVKLGRVDYSSDGREFSVYKDPTTDIANVNIPMASVTKDGLMSDSDFAKLSTVEQGAERNTIVGIKVNGETVIVDSERYANITSTRYFEATRQEGETDLQAIARALGGTEARNGFVCVIKTLIADGKYSHTAFIYDGETSAWKAMDGNYDAENVYFRNDLIAAGNYTQVGNITKTQTGTVTIPASGKSVKDVFTKIFTERLQPTVTNPTVSITVSGAGEKETGTIVAPTYTVITTTGSYTYGPATGVTFTGFDVRNNREESSTTTQGTFSPYTVLDGVNDYDVSVSASHTEGVIAKDNLGNDSYPVQRISAGMKTNSKENIYTGYRQYFVGVDDNNVSPIDSAFIRNLPKKGKVTTSMFTYAFTETAGPAVVYVCIPNGYSLSKVIDVNGMRADITGIFIEDASQVAVYGATAGQNPMNYKVYRYVSSTKLNANTYEITLSKN